jgi:hypothetical protein
MVIGLERLRDCLPACFLLHTPHAKPLTATAIQVPEMQLYQWEKL